MVGAITKLIQSPPGQVVAGGVLAGTVWKLFERVESVLSEDTKLEIAVWLLDRKRLSPTFQSWPGTFAKVFDRIFGQRHLSLRCFLLSALLSFVFGILLTVYSPNPYHGLPLGIQLLEALKQLAMDLLFGKLIADYLSLLSTRLTLYFMQRTQAALLQVALVGADAIVTAYLAIVGLAVGLFVGGPLLERIDPGYYVLKLNWQDVTNIAAHVPQHPVLFLRAVMKAPHVFPLFLSGFVTSVWLWLYAGAGFFLKAARRFDISFQWFNRKFDIEKKPLQSIGVVAGALAAILYWAAVIVSRIGS